MAMNAQLKSFFLLFLLLVVVVFLHSSSGHEANINGFGDGTKTTHLVHQMKVMRKLKEVGIEVDYVLDPDHNTRHEKGTPGAGGKNNP